MYRNAGSKPKQRPHLQDMSATPPGAGDRVFKTAAQLFYRKVIEAYKASLRNRRAGLCRQTNRGQERPADGLSLLM